MNSILDDIQQQINDSPDSDVIITPEDAVVLLQNVRRMMKELEEDTPTPDAS